MRIGTKCIVNSDFIRWYNEEPAALLMLELGDDVEVSYVSPERRTGIVRNPENGISVGGVPFDVLEKMRVKR